MSKPNKTEAPNYIIVTPVEEMLDDGAMFVGNDERERVLSVMQFTKVRNMLQRYAQTLSSDEIDALKTILKSYLVIKKEG